MGKSTYRPEIADAAQTAKKQLFEPPGQTAKQTAMDFCHRPRQTSGGNQLLSQAEMKLVAGAPGPFVPKTETVVWPTAGFHAPTSNHRWTDQGNPRDAARSRFEVVSCRLGSIFSGRPESTKNSFKTSRVNKIQLFN